MNDYLYLIWQGPISRRNFTIGKLTHSDNYIFEYMPEISEAKKEGWDFLKSFPEDKKYESETVFPVFTSRLPDRKRRDIDKILEKYSLNAYDEFELLRKSGAQLPIDTYRFIAPIFPDDETIQCEFYIMGVHYYADCQDTSCERFDYLLNHHLTLVPEPTNEHDKNAIYIETETGQKLGYVPRYYSAAILKHFKDNYSYSCIVIDINHAKCSECIKVRLNMPSV